MLRLTTALLVCVAQLALGQNIAPIPAGITEQQLYANLGPLDQCLQGYGNGASGKVERIYNQPQEEAPEVETLAGQDQVVDHIFPEEQKQNRIDNTKEIHDYMIKHKTFNVNNRILHRYLKSVLVNTRYNTNIQKVNHEKLINLLITTLQETHQPKLLLKYSRQDTVQDLGQRSEQPVVENEHKENTLPAIFVPATAEKIGYDGLALGSTIDANSINLLGASASGASSGSFGSSAAGSSSSSSSSSTGLSQRTLLPVGLNAGSTYDTDSSSVGYNNDVSSSIGSGIGGGASSSSIDYTGAINGLAQQQQQQPQYVSSGYNSGYNSGSSNGIIGTSSQYSAQQQQSIPQQQSYQQQTGSNSSSISDQSDANNVNAGNSQQQQGGYTTSQQQQQQNGGGGGGGGGYVSSGLHGTSGLSSSTSSNGGHTNNTYKTSKNF